jgi:hypothetical protein
MMIGDMKVPGTPRFTIGFDLVVSWSMEMPSDDLSGNTSLTDKADKGIKPKKLSVAFSIRENHEELAYWTQFLLLLEAKDAAGQGKEYVVVHPLVQASRIRMMRVIGSVKIGEHAGMRQYDAGFELEEVRSVPEASESREQKRQAGGQPSTSFEAALAKIEGQAKA